MSKLHLSKEQVHSPLPTKPQTALQLGVPPVVQSKRSKGNDEPDRPIEISNNPPPPLYSPSRPLDFASPPLDYSTPLLDSSAPPLALNNPSQEHTTRVKEDQPPRVPLPPDPPTIIATLPRIRSPRSPERRAKPPVDTTPVTVNGFVVDPAVLPPIQKIEERDIPSPTKNKQAAQSLQPSPPTDESKSNPPVRVTTAAIKRTQGPTSASRLIDSLFPWERENETSNPDPAGSENPRDAIPGRLQQTDKAAGSVPTPVDRIPSSSVDGYSLTPSHDPSSTTSNRESRVSSHGQSMTASHGQSMTASHGSSATSSEEDVVIASPGLRVNRSGRARKRDGSVSLAPLVRPQRTSSLAGNASVASIPLDLSTVSSIHTEVTEVHRVRDTKSQQHEEAAFAEQKASPDMPQNVSPDPIRDNQMKTSTSQGQNRKEDQHTTLRGIHDTHVPTAESQEIQHQQQSRIPPTTRDQSQTEKARESTGQSGQPVSLSQAEMTQGQKPMMPKQNPERVDQGRVHTYSNSGQKDNGLHHQMLPGGVHNLSQQYVPNQFQAFGGDPGYYQGPYPAYQPATYYQRGPQEAYYGAYSPYQGNHNNGQMTHPGSENNGVPQPATLTKSIINAAKIHNYSGYSELEKEQFRAKFKIEFEKLKKVLKDHDVPSVNDSDPLELIHARFDVYHRQKLAYDDAGKYMLWMSVGWVVLEVICVKWLFSSDMSGLATTMYKMKSHYMPILMEIGENNHKVTDAAELAAARWAPETRLLLTSLGSAAIFIGLKLVVRWLFGRDANPTQVIDWFSAYFADAPKPVNTEVGPGPPEVKDSSPDLSTVANVVISTLGSSPGGGSIGGILGGMFQSYLGGGGGSSSPAQGGRPRVSVPVFNE
jgi:hypothetical protein